MNRPDPTRPDAAAADPHRRTWAVEKNLTDRAEAEQVCAAVLMVLEPALHSASLDVISDFPDLMPDDVRAAEATLLLLARREQQHTRLDLPATASAWPAFKTYASWSIDVDLYGQDGTLLGGFHDCGYSITAELTDSEAHELQQRIQPVSAVRPPAEIHAKHRSERSARRRARLRQWLPGH